MPLPSSSSRSPSPTGGLGGVVSAARPSSPFSKLRPRSRSMYIGSGGSVGGGAEGEASTPGRAPSGVLFPPAPLTGLGTASPATSMGTPMTPARRLHDVDRGGAVVKVKRWNLVLSVKQLQAKVKYLLDMLPGEGPPKQLALRSAHLAPSVGPRSVSTAGGGGRAQRTTSDTPYEPPPGADEDARRQWLLDFASLQFTSAVSAKRHLGAFNSPARPLSARQSPRRPYDAASGSSGTAESEVARTWAGYRKELRGQAGGGMTASSRRSVPPSPSGSGAANHGIPAAASAPATPTKAAGHSSGSHTATSAATPHTVARTARAIPTRPATAGAGVATGSVPVPRLLRPSSAQPHAGGGSAGGSATPASGSTRPGPVLAGGETPVRPLPPPSRPQPQRPLSARVESGRGRPTVPSPA